MRRSNELLERFAVKMAQEAKQSAQLIPIIWMNVSLIQDATQGANWDFAFPGHNGGVHGLAKPPHKLDVTALLASFDEPRGLKPAFNLAKWQGTKPPQPQPRSCELWRGE